MVEGVQRIDNYWFKSSHLIVEDKGPWRPKAKTRRYNVYTLKHALLGNILWYGAWRQYTYFPLDSTLYSHDCLRELAEFCQYLTEEHKLKLPLQQITRERIRLKREKRIEEIRQRKLLTYQKRYDRVVKDTKEVPTSAVVGMVEGCDLAPEVDKGETYDS